MGTGHLQQKTDLKKESLTSLARPVPLNHWVRLSIFLKRKKYIIPRFDQSIPCLSECSQPCNTGCTLTMRWREKGNSNVNFNKINLACWFHCNVILAQCPEGGTWVVCHKRLYHLRLVASLLGSVARRWAALKKPHPINWNCRRPLYRHVYTIYLFSFMQYFM